MKLSNLKISIYVYLFFLFSQSTYSQVKIGTNPTNIQNGSLLELQTSGTRAGFKIAEVALTGALDNTTTPVASNSVGMLVWNTATSGTAPNQVTPGFYVWTGARWEELITSVAGNDKNVYEGNGILTGNRIIGLGNHNLALTSTASTGTSHFTVDGTTFNVDAVNNRIGLGNAAPTERLDVTGNIKFSGTFLPNNLSGSNGQVLTSTGNSTPVWTTPNTLYTSNGTLTNNRTVTLGNNNIEFTSTATTGTSHFTVDGSTFNVNAVSNSVGMGTSTPAASAVLDVNATNKGFLPPRMTTTQRNLIVSPSAGLVIYNTITNSLNVYNGTSWDNLGGSSQGVPVGVIAAFYGTSIPNGWLLCNGSTFVATDYPDLNTFLGSNVLPDLRGVFLRGAGVTTANGMVNGTNYNATTVRAFQGDAFKSHTHNVRLSIERGAGNRNGSAPMRYVPYIGVDGQNTTIGAALANGDSETRPKNVGVNYIIKAF